MNLLPFLTLKTLHLILFDVIFFQWPPEVRERTSFCQESLSGGALTFFTLNVGELFFFLFFKFRLERITAIMS